MEVLVVLVIVGIASGALVLGLGGVDRATTVQIEANRFAQSLRQASDEVLVAGTPLSVVWSPSTYGFEGLENLEEALARPHALPNGIQLTGPNGLGSMVIDPDSAAPPAEFIFRKGSVAWTVQFDGLGTDVRPVSSGGEG